MFIVVQSKWSKRKLYSWRVAIGQSICGLLPPYINILTSEVRWKNEIGLAVMVNLGDVFPDFKVDTSEGEIQFHEYIKDS